MAGERLSDLKKTIDEQQETAVDTLGEKGVAPEKYAESMKKLDDFQGQVLESEISTKQKKEIFSTITNFFTDIGDIIEGIDEEDAEDDF